MLDLLPEASDGRRLSLGMKALRGPRPGAARSHDSLAGWAEMVQEIRDRLGLNKKHPKVTLGREGPLHTCGDAPGRHHGGLLVSSRTNR